MTLFSKEYIMELLQFAVMVPSAILCFLPVRKKLRIPAKQLIVFASCFLLAVILICPLIENKAGVDIGYVFVPLLVLSFVIYVFLLDAPLEIKISIFLLVMALMTFPANFSVAIDASKHPWENIDDLCFLAPFWQLVISLFFLFSLGPFFEKQLKDLVKSSEGIRIPWILTSILFFMILFINVYVQPREYETLYVNRIFSIYVFSQFFFLAVLLFVCSIFYLVMNDMRRSANDRMRLGYLEMQESQYHFQQHYMEETSRMRHDFRHQIHAIKDMSDRKEYEKLAVYIDSISRSIPESSITWTKNLPVNALLNHYASLMRDEKIDLNWNIGLADNIDVSDMDLCSLFGNILENAYYGCLTVPADERFHDLTVKIENDKNLFAISVNSFDGIVKKKNKKYVSTRRNGTGTGLYSIGIISEKYGGYAKAYNTKDRFIVDVKISC